jgi:hypothetical protein
MRSPTFMSDKVSDSSRPTFALGASVRTIETLETAVLLVATALAVFVPSEVPLTVMVRGDNDVIFPVALACACGARPAPPAAPPANPA